MGGTSPSTPKFPNWSDAARAPLIIPGWRDGGSAAAEGVVGIGLGGVVLVMVRILLLSPLQTQVPAPAHLRPLREGHGVDGVVPSSGCAGME